MVDKSKILNNIKQHLKINTDKGFAEFLNIKPTTLSMWHKRNTMDIELIFNKCEFINSEWLLTGEGEMLKKPEPGENKKVKEFYFEEKSIEYLEKLPIEDKLNTIINQNIFLLKKLKKAQKKTEDILLLFKSDFLVKEVEEKVKIYLENKPQLKQ